jgi:hypothetical protein
MPQQPPKQTGKQPTAAPRVDRRAALRARDRRAGRAFAGWIASRLHARDLDRQHSP